MTQRERLDRNTKPTNALAVTQKHKRDLKHNKKTSIESEERKQWKDWSKLPDDIVRHIVANLCWSDRIRLRAVCKSLRSLVHEVQTTDEFPWIMSYHWERESFLSDKINSFCRLADPSAQKCYVIEDADKGKERDGFEFAKPCASRNGWVLFHDWDQFFFYSPFTNEFIKLPKLDLDSTSRYLYRYLNATFSSNPTSPDCVVFVLSPDVKLISTWSPCDKTWTHTKLGDLCGKSADVTYAGGIFYCVFEDGKLGAYNVVLKDWKLFANVLPLKGFTVYLIESSEDKELLVIVCASWHCMMCASWHCWKLWRFDLSQESWVEEHRIGNRVIFLGCTSYSVPAVGRSSKFADKIHYLGVIDHNAVPICASLESTAFECQTGLYDWMPRKRIKKSIWIKPPLQ